MEILNAASVLAVWYIAGLEQGGPAMPDEPPPSIVIRALASKIVGAYVRRNQVGADQMPLLIATVHQALASLGKPAKPEPGKRVPAVPIRRSVTEKFVVCLECGWQGKLLRRHVGTAHGLSVAGYRSRWNLSAEHPMVAPSYSAQRSGMAREFGLGRSRAASGDESSPSVSASASEAVPRRRGRPRRPATTEPE
jgi:predicted transcriptional regulator